MTQHGGGAYSAKQQLAVRKRDALRQRAEVQTLLRSSTKLIHGCRLLPAVRRAGHGEAQYGAAALAERRGGTHQPPYILLLYA